VLLEKIKRGGEILILFFLLTATLVMAGPIEKESYSINIDSLNLILSPNELDVQKIILTNKKTTPLIASFQFQGNASAYMELVEYDIVVEPNSKKEISLSIFGGDTYQTHTGSIVISDDVNEEIPVMLDISEKNTSTTGTLMTELDILEATVATGSPLHYRLDLRNLVADNNYNIDLEYLINRISEDNLTGGLTNITTNETITLENSESLVRNIPIPKNLQIGDYSLTVRATYLNYTSVVKGLFIVERPFQEKRVGGLVPVWVIITTLSFIAASYLVFLFIRHQLNKNKRFNAKVDYKAMPKDGDRSIFVGNFAETKKRCFLDMDNLTVHSIVAGSTGGGKSIAAQDIVEECLLKGAAVCVFDPTAQWSGMLRKLADKKFLSFYVNFGLNPKKDPKAFPGNIKAVKDYREVIDIFHFMKAGEIQVFTTNKLDPKDYDIFVANMIRQVFRSNLAEFRGLKYLLVFDEIHRILPKFGGSGAGFTQIERGCREFRKWGIGIVLISQVLSDFVGEIKANINTLVQMKTRDEGDLNRIKMQYGEEFIQALVKAPVGSGMVQNAAYNHGKPFYVTFRPIYHSVVRLTDDELENYNVYNDVIDQLSFEFDQLEEKGQDVFDLRLELKLCQDKVKAGNFNMVKIYLDGLTPRVEKVWDKVGSKPQKLEIKLVSEEELAEDLAKAKASHDKAAKDDKSSEGPAKEEEVEDVKLDEDQLKENLAAVDKLFGDAQESLDSGDVFAVNDRLIEVKSIPLPKVEKDKVLKRVSDFEKKVDEVKKKDKEGGES
jgi:hypothetical protein